MADAVFDSSALLALLLNEPGGDNVASLLTGGITSAVIACEVETRLIDKGTPPAEAAAIVRELAVRTEDFTAAEASAAAQLRNATRKVGLSLGDRACLALAQRTGLPVYTADRPWVTLGLPLDIRLIR